MTQFAPILALEARTLRVCNRLNGLPGSARFFAFVSRLGDGIFWYALTAAFVLLLGAPGLRLAVLMAVVGVSTALLYKVLKRVFRRARPASRMGDLVTTVAPLDEFSFPSGHTMHACAFSTVALSFLPGLAWVLVPFTLAVAVSRLVLGLHYVTDVVIGAALGLALGVVGVRCLGPWVL